MEILLGVQIDQSLQRDTKFEGLLKKDTRLVGLFKVKNILSYDPWKMINQFTSVLIKTTYICLERPLMLFSVVSWRTKKSEMGQCRSMSCIFI